MTDLSTQDRAMKKKDLLAANDLCAIRDELAEEKGYLI
jgi:hypothetical protein